MADRVPALTDLTYGADDARFSLISRTVGIWPLGRPADALDLAPIPALLSVGGAVSAAVRPLDKVKFAQIRRRLEARRKTGSKTT